MSGIKYGGHTAQELKVARAAGTKGKWDHYGGNATHCIHVEGDGSNAICPHDVLVAYGYEGKKYLPGVANYADARLIVLAVNALPDLLARIEQLEAENGRLRTALKPFAAAAKHWEDPPGSITHDNVELWQRGKLVDYLTCGDLRKAKAALL